MSTKIIYALNERNCAVLRPFLFPMFDNRIGNYLEAQIVDVLPHSIVDGLPDSVIDGVPQSVKKVLKLTDPFPLNDPADDENNFILILPTDHAPNLRDLFSKAYLVCNSQRFNVNVGNWFQAGVEVPNLVNFTVIELLEVTGYPVEPQYETQIIDDEEVQVLIEQPELQHPTDMEVIDFIVADYNSKNPNKKISHPVLFRNRAELLAKMNVNFV